MKCRHEYKPEWYNDYVENWECYCCIKCNKFLWLKKGLFNKGV